MPEFTTIRNDGPQRIRNDGFGKLDARDGGDEWGEMEFGQAEWGGDVTQPGVRGPVRMRNQRGGFVKIRNPQ